MQGKYPDGRNNINPLVPKNSYSLLNARYKAIVDCYAKADEKRGVHESTVYGNKAIASSIFLKLQQSGIEELANAVAENIMPLFVEPDGRIERHYSCASKFAKVLRICVPVFPDCANILTLLPVFKERRKNIQYLTPQEYSKIKEKLLNSTSGLSLRNRAMGLLALFTGLRGCDITGLKLSAIDWDRDVMHIQQQKTGVHLTLPLSAIVGNAVYDYIERERPDSDCEFVFISRNRPFGRITSMGSIVAGIMKAADIRQNRGDRKGTHIFRHHLMTRLLENGVPRPVISSIAGQKSPKSLDDYLYTDFVHLKKCAVSIENFPVAKEVFNR